MLLFCVENLTEMYIFKNIILASFPLIRTPDITKSPWSPWSLSCEPHSTFGLQPWARLACESITPSVSPYRGPPGPASWQRDHIPPSLSLWASSLQVGTHSAMTSDLARSIPLNCQKLGSPILTLAPSNFIFVCVIPCLCPLENRKASFCSPCYFCSSIQCLVHSRNLIHFCLLASAKNSWTVSVAFLCSKSIVQALSRKINHGPWPKL